jgi:hypothetical protein
VSPLCCTRHTPHVTRHTPHATRRTSHVTRHTSHATRHKSHVTHHTSHVTRHTSHVTRHTSHVTRHTSHVTGVLVDAMSSGLIPTSVSHNDAKIGNVLFKAGASTPRATFLTLSHFRLAFSPLFAVLRGVFAGDLSFICIIDFDTMMQGTPLCARCFFAVLLLHSASSSSLDVFL